LLEGGAWVGKLNVKRRGGPTHIRGGEPHSAGPPSVVGPGGEKKRRAILTTPKVAGSRSVTFFVGGGGTSSAPPHPGGMQFQFLHPIPGRTKYEVFGLPGPLVVVSPPKRNQTQTKTTSKLQPQRGRASVSRFVVFCFHGGPTHPPPPGGGGWAPGFLVTGFHSGKNPPPPKKKGGPPPNFWGSFP